MFAHAEKAGLCMISPLTFEDHRQTLELDRHELDRGICNALVVRR